MREIKAGTVWFNDPLTDNDAGPVRGLQAVGARPRARPRGPRGLPGDEARPHRVRGRAEGVVVPVLASTRAESPLTGRPDRLGRSGRPAPDALPRRDRRATSRGIRGGCTCRATRAPAPTASWPRSSAPPRSCTTCRPASRGSTSRRPSRRRSSGPSSWRPRPGARERSWFLLNGASGGNHAICLALAHARHETDTGPPNRGPVIVQRNVHSSTIDGLVLSGLRPHFVAPEIDPELGIAHCVTPEALEGALDAVPDRPRGPDRLADLLRRRRAGRRAGRGRARARHPAGRRRGLGRAPLLPSRACRRAPSATAPTSSSPRTHKIVGSLTQSAILHLGAREYVDENLLDRSVTLIETDQPQRPARRVARRGAPPGRDPRPELLAETLADLARTREQIREIPGLDVLDERLGASSVAAWDPLRLSVDVRGHRRDGPPDRRADARPRRRRRRALLGERDRRGLRHRRGDRGERRSGSSPRCGTRSRRSGPAT